MDCLIIKLRGREADFCRSIELHGTLGASSLLRTGRAANIDQSVSTSSTRRTCMRRTC